MFSGHRDIRCRYHSLFTLSNLCSNPEHHQAIVNAGALSILISFSFPPAVKDSTNAQFQAISGIRGLATDRTLRVKIIDGGVLEPLVIAATGLNKNNDIEVQRESAAALCNLALDDSKKLEMSQSGVISAMLKLCSLTDAPCQLFAISTLTNLAEGGSSIQKRILSEGCVKKLLSLIENHCLVSEVKREISRFLSLIANNIDLHPLLLQDKASQCLNKLITTNEDTECQRYAVLCAGNLAITKSTHVQLIQSGILSHIVSLAKSSDKILCRCIAFALNNISNEESNHRECEKCGVLHALTFLLKCEDLDTRLQAIVCVKNLTIFPRGRSQFVDFKGLNIILNLCRIENTELRRELMAALRNISISDQNKIQIVEENGMEVIVEMCRMKDEGISHQACGVIANIAEANKNQEYMIKTGILHHIKFAMRSEFMSIIRESVRALANLSSHESSYSFIVGSGIVAQIVRALESEDKLTQQFATMATANLVSHKESLARIIEDGGLVPLSAIAKDCSLEYSHSQENAFIALTNISTYSDQHEKLLEMSVLDLAVKFLNDKHTKLRSCALHFISNFASNISNHHIMQEYECMNLILPFITNEDTMVKLKAVASIRGFSTSKLMRDQMYKINIIDKLLSLATIDNIDIQIEVIGALCNLSIGGCIGQYAEKFLNVIKTHNLVSFLCSTDTTFRLFGAVTIGNIASEKGLQSTVLKGGALHSLINMSHVCDIEAKRSISYAVVNLCTDFSNRERIVSEGGLRSLFSLASSEDPNDILVGLSSIRALASNHNLRRNILTTGCIDALSQTINRDISDECKKEISTILCALSLNDENKIDLVKGGAINLIMSLCSHTDNSLMGNSLRAVANCCEAANLHRMIIESLDFILIDCIIQDDHSYENSRQVSRMFANLSGNQECQYIILKGSVMSIVGNLLTSIDKVTLRISSLIISNLTSYIHNHQKIHNENGASIFRALVNIVRAENCQINNQPSASQPDIGNFASLALGGLLQSELFDESMKVDDHIPLIVQNLKINNTEGKFMTSFALLRLSTKSHMTQLLLDAGAIPALIHFISHTLSDSKAYAIASLRHLSTFKQSRYEIIKYDGLEVLFSACQNSSNAILREILACFCYLTICEESRLFFTNKIVFKKLINFSQNADIEISRFAIATIGNMAEQEELQEEMIKEYRVIEYLTTSMKSRNLSIKRESSRALSNLFTKPEGHHQFINSNGLDTILGVVKSFDQECEYNSAIIFHKLSENISNHTLDFYQKAMNLIISLVLSENNETKNQGLAALRALASDDEFHDVFVKEGGMRISVDQLSTSDLPSQTIAAGILRHLSIPHGLKIKLYQDNLLKTLFNLVENSEDEDLLSQCTAIIANLSENSRNKAKMAEDGILAMLARLCTMETDLISRELARAFCNLSSASENLKHFFCGQEIEGIISLLFVKNFSTAMNAATSIGNLSIKTETQLTIAKLGAIKPLYTLLALPDKGCQLMACRALSKLTLPHENKRLLVTNENLGIIIKLCWSSDLEVTRMASMLFCNISSCEDIEKFIPEMKDLNAILNLTLSPCVYTRRNATKSLCNLAKVHLIQKYYMHHGGLKYLSRLLQNSDDECKEYAAMSFSNLTSKSSNRTLVINCGVITSLAMIICGNHSLQSQRAALLTTYNLSTSEISHGQIVDASIIKYLLRICSESDTISKRYAIMTISNIAANPSIRQSVTRGGGLQSTILMLKENDIVCKRYASICLANMANDKTTQSQVILHGGLSSLISHTINDDAILQMNSLICLGNISANELNHDEIIRKGTLKTLIKIFLQSDLNLKEMCAFVIANLASNSDILEKVGISGGIPPLVTLSKSKNMYARCLGLVSLRRLSLVPRSRQILFETGILSLIADATSLKEVELQREVSSCLCNLSLSRNQRLDIANKCLGCMCELLQSNDVETIRHTVGTLGNLSEDFSICMKMVQIGLTDKILCLLHHTSICVRREASRVICNLSSLDSEQETIIQGGLYEIIRLSSEDDDECKYHTALCLRKLGQNSLSHAVIFKYGLTSLKNLLKSSCFNTRTKAATALRDLCANSKYKVEIEEAGIVEELIDIVRQKDIEMQTLCVACLRHLSEDPVLKKKIVDCGSLPPVIRCTSWATEDLKCQISGLLANVSEREENHAHIVKAGTLPVLIRFCSNTHLEILQVMFDVMKKCCGCIFCYIFTVRLFIYCPYIII